MNREQKLEKRLQNILVRTQNLLNRKKKVFISLGKKKFRTELELYLERNKDVKQIMIHGGDLCCSQCAIPTKNIYDRDDPQLINALPDARCIRMEPGCVCTFKGIK